MKLAFFIVRGSKTLDGMICVMHRLAGTRKMTHRRLTGEIMEKKIIKALPDIFSLRSRGNYFDIISHTSAKDRMDATWNRVGARMNRAVLKVGADVERRKNTR